MSDSESAHGASPNSSHGPLEELPVASDASNSSRRAFLEQFAVSALALALPANANASSPVAVKDSASVIAANPGIVPVTVANHPRPPQSRDFLNLLRPPDAIMVQSTSSDIALTRTPAGLWTSNDIAVSTTTGTSVLHVTLSAPSTAIKRIQLRWRGNMTDVQLTLGDAWERAYGDLEWRTPAPDRMLPWYLATFNGTRTDTYGVRTGAKAFCFWQIDAHGLSCWADVRSGGAGIQLASRTLDVCDIVCREGRPNESAFAAVHAFCKQMCPNPRLPSAPVYGSNDWYWAYGENSAASVRTDAQHIVELSPTSNNRPFAVIDDGWQPERSKDKSGIGTWDHGNEKFGDMSALATTIRQTGARPGLWIRPLQAMKDTPDGWRLARDKQFLDPTVPEVREKIAADISRIHAWGFELIKHDYTSYDIFGRWGFQMTADMTRNGWTFAAGPSRTTAEVIDELYRTIRTAAADSVIIGCNTISHLSAGHFEICRVGDDTSGTSWSRVRKMGVNSLAFRGAQHGAFYVADADCIGVTNSIPWALNKQWLDLLSRSGTMTFVSLAPDALGVEQRRDVRSALAVAARTQPLAEPLDWQRNVYPSRWKMSDGRHTYDWVDSDGAGLP